jgi:putative methyltransferase (TIGR04325 family)
MKQFIKSIPYVKETYRYFRRLGYERRFQNECYGCFWGIFETLDQAIQAAPKTKPIGYDNDELAQEYVQMLESEDWEHTNELIRPYDYPVLFWLNSIFNHDSSNTVFDFGGNVGIHFYSYKKYLSLDSKNWIIYDFPKIVATGKALAAKRGIDNLNFTTSMDDASQADIFLASGSAQYVENFSGMIQSLPHSPKHILINRLPLYDGKQFATLQNGGKVFYAQYVFNQTQFIKGFEQAGYDLLDIWKDPSDGCVLLDNPEHSVLDYHGFYLRLSR